MDTSAPRRSAGRGRRRSEPILPVLRRLVPLARRLVGAVRLLAFAAVASIAVVVAVVLAHGVPDVVTGALLLIVVAVMAPAPIVLLLFHGALREVLALPAWLRSSPDLAKGHAAELSDLVASARRGRDTAGSLPRGGFLRDTWRAGRLLLQAHDDLPGYGAILRLMSPVFLLAVLVATAAAIAEVGMALAFVVTDVVLRLVL